ncbi:hypothetical protein [Deinococcus sp.]|uniref:hypothetical protein n=1 Tax=Deinococcus sp. TaxID=47478 RepID=UPI003CC5C841
MIGTYKLARQHLGRFHFGEIAVSVEGISSGISNYENIAVKIEPDWEAKMGTIQDDFRESSIVGVRKFISAYPRDSWGKRFVVTKILATNIDTEDQALETVAFLACFNALFPTAPLPDLQYSVSGGWQVGG